MSTRDWIRRCNCDKYHSFLTDEGDLDNEQSQEELDLLFDNDFSCIQRELSQHAWYTTQPQNIQAAVINMCFMLGIDEVLGFRKMIASLACFDYTKAALEALNSKWDEKVSHRAKDVAIMIKQGL